MKNSISRLLILLICTLLCCNLSSCRYNYSTENQAEQVALPEYVSSYYPGTRTETSYDSEWAGIHYELPKGFTMLSDEETWEMMGLGAETFLDEDMSDKLVDYLKNSDTGTVEFFAENSLKFSVIGTVEKSNYDEMTYLNTLAEQLESVQVDNYLRTAGDPYEFEINGVDFLRLDIEAYETKNDYTVYQTYLCKKIDEVTHFTLIFSSFLDINDAYIKGISPYNGEAESN